MSLHDEAVEAAAREWGREYYGIREADMDRWWEDDGADIRSAMRRAIAAFLRREAEDIHANELNRPKWLKEDPFSRYHEGKLRQVADELDSPPELTAGKERVKR